MGNWADHEPPGGWDAPEPKKVPGGIEIGHHFFPWSYFDVIPAAKLRQAEAERDDLLSKGKRAKKEAAEAERRARLANLSTPDRTAPRYLKLEGGWRWHVWDPRLGGLVDTGLHPGQRGVGYPPEEWERALADAALHALDQFRGPPKES